MFNPNLFQRSLMNNTNSISEVYSPGIGETATLDLSLSNIFVVNMPAGNATIAVSNQSANQNFSVSIVQDSVGGRTVTWFSTINWTGGSQPTLSTTAGVRDIFGFTNVASDLFQGYIIGQNIL